MSTYEWLLALHVSGAFLLLGGAVTAGILNVLARGRERPSEIALLLGLVRVAVAAIGVGAVLTLVLGIWLVEDTDGLYGYGQVWIWLALLLWLASQAAGGIGGRRERATRLLAQRLAAEGDAPSAELRTLLRDPVTTALSWGSGFALLIVLALMLFKPGGP